MEFFQCLPLSKAQDVIHNSLEGKVVESEVVHLTAALGRVAAEDIAAKEDLPPFSRSTVDGYAVRSADTFGASEAVPSLFIITGEVFMGEQTVQELRPGEAMAIPTGGMLPAGADAVVMLEYTEQPDAKTLLALKTVAPGENVIAQGEDVQRGRIIVQQGQRLSPQHIGILAACGCIEIKVYKPITATVISTGDELVDIQEIPQIGQIRDVNSYALGAMLEELGCHVHRVGIIRDSYDKFFHALAQAIRDSQLVVISGGSSVGARDYTVEAIGALGNPGILIHGLAVKPGKPTIFGMVNNVPVFGLPGHPVAAMMICRQLVRQAVGTLSGQRPAENFPVTAQLVRNIASAPGRDDFINVRLRKQEGKYTAEPILGKSGLISIMSQADGILHIPAEKSGVYEGELVEVFRVNNREGGANVAQ